MGFIAEMGMIRTDATDWRNETRSRVNFKVGYSVVTRNHHHSFTHPEGTCLVGYPQISRFSTVEVAVGCSNDSCRFS